MDNNNPNKESKEEKLTASSTPENKIWKKCPAGALKKIIIIIGVLLIILLSFAAGVGIALRKARFNCLPRPGLERGYNDFQMKGRGENGLRGFLREFEGRDFPSGHGLLGTVSSITDNNVVVKDRTGKETTVVVSDKTRIISRGVALKVSDLQGNEQIMVMGKPDDNGVVNATLVKIIQNAKGAAAKNIQIWPGVTN